MKKIGAVIFAIACIFVGLIVGFSSLDAFAMTESEADSACSSLPSLKSDTQSNSIKCYMDQAAQSECKKVGGTFTGKQGEYFVCIIPFTKSSTSGSKTGDEKSSTEATTSTSTGTGVTGGSTSGDYGSGMDTGSTECGDGASSIFFGTNGCYDESENGGGVFTILNVILSILTWGVGIAGTFGIVISGIQYMTAKDDPAQMTKAKNRIIQIVIGLAVYAVAWAFIQWVLPGGVFGN